MSKKKKKKKSSKNKKDKKSNSKQLSKEEINDLKKNLLVKTDSNHNKKEKEIKSVKKKEKEKVKEIKKEKKEEKIIINKIKEEKKQIEENKEKDKKINNTQNGGIIQKSKSKKNKKRIQKDEKLGPTLLQLIKNKENVTDVTLNDENYSSRNKNNTKKGQKKYSLDKSEEIKPKNEIDDKNEYIKKLKAKIVMVNGRMVMEKPDVGSINKKYNEEHYKNISPIETVFANNEEKVVNSLSFLNKKPTKKWTEEETDLFYKAIETFGLDFSFLEIVLKKRTREEIKRKYLKEKKENFGEIDKAINARKDVGKLKQILELYKGEKGQNYLGLFKEESFRSRRNNSSKNEKVDYDKEYKNILNK